MQRKLGVTEGLATNHTPRLQESHTTIGREMDARRKNHRKYMKFPEKRKTSKEIPQRPSTRDHTLRNFLVWHQQTLLPELPTVQTCKVLGVKDT